MHARRYFVEALEAGELHAAIPLKWIKHLYKIEEYAKDLGADARQRQAIRQKKSKPVLEKLGKWLAKNHSTVADDLLLSDAIG